MCHSSTFEDFSISSALVLINDRIDLDIWLSDVSENDFFDEFVLAAFGVVNCFPVTAP